MYNGEAAAQLDKLQKYSVSLILISTFCMTNTGLKVVFRVGELKLGISHERK